MCSPWNTSLKWCCCPWHSQESPQQANPSPQKPVGKGPALAHYVFQFFFFFFFMILWLRSCNQTILFSQRHFRTAGHSAWISFCGAVYPTGRIRRSVDDQTVKISFAWKQNTLNIKQKWKMIRWVFFISSFVQNFLKFEILIELLTGKGGWVLLPGKNIFMLKTLPVFGSWG